jgi:tetratricopeptide (TPR) repeat protein
LQAQALAEEGDVEGAEASLKKLVEYEPAVSSHLLYGIFLSSQGREEHALLEYQAAVRAARGVEERTQARLILSNFYLNRRDYEAAEKELLEAREEVPEDASLLLTLAQFYALRGEEARAEEMLEDRVAQLPDDPIPLLVLADFHRRLGKPEQALKTVDRALALDPKSELARLRKAEYLLGVMGGDPSPAQKATAKRLVEEVLAENPNSLRGLFTEGKFLLVEGRNEEAATRLRRVIEEQPDSNAHVLLGTAYVRMGQRELARGEFLQALQLDAGNQLARTQLAALYLQSGELALADQQAQAALERQPGNVSLLLIRVRALTGLQRKQEALKVLQAIPLNESSMLPLRLAVAGLFRLNGEFDSARAILEAVPGYEENPAVIAELTHIEEEGGNLQQAIALLNRAIEHNPDEPQLYELRGRVYAKMRADGSLTHAKEAERDLRTSLEKDPKRVEPYKLLSSLYQLTNRPEEAVASYQRALEVNPTAEVYLRLGAQYEAMGRLKLARENYEAALRLDQEQPLAQNNLAWLLADAENPSAEQLDRALELAQDAKEKLPRNPNVADTLGWVMFKKNLPAAAVSLFQEAIRGYSDNAELRSLARYHLAQTYERTGERELAIGELELALEEAPSFPERGGAEALLKRLSRA